MKTIEKIFVPVIDELLYDSPESITAPLRPYKVDMPCFHWMASIESAVSGVELYCVNHRIFNGLHVS